MKIKQIGDAKIIMSNPHSKHNYFGWPTVARLQNGKIAAVASGFRLEHVCPFGKMVISYSEDEGETYTLPAPVIDCPLDDRDGGILAFGEKNVIVTSFNNRREAQRKWLDTKQPSPLVPYSAAYLDTITDEEEETFIGSTYRISTDFGVTFGDIQKSPVTSPHGPIELNNGELLWIGNHFEGVYENKLRAYIIHMDGTSEFMGEIPQIIEDGEILNSDEPHAIQLEDGTILCHIRVGGGTQPHFSTYQSESTDGGRTWSEPHRLLELLGGAPAHLMRHSSGMLISVYGYRLEPFGIKAMFSTDNGKTWDIGHDIYIDNVSGDLGYPSTVELKDGSLLTIFYAHPSANEPAVIMQQHWSLEE